MTNIGELDALVPAWLTLDEACERLGVSIGKVKQLVRDHELAAAPHGEKGRPHVPAAFLDGNQIVRGLGGTLTLLADGGYDDADAVRWLFTEEPALGRTPMQALVDNRPTEVHRLAQVMGF